MGELQNNLPTNSANIYPQAPIPELGYFKPELNEYTNLEHWGRENLGAIVFISYVDSQGAAQRIVGRVLLSHQALLIVQNEESGQVFNINTNLDKINSLWLKPLPAAWIELNQFQDDFLDQVDSVKTNVAVIHASNPDRRGRGTIVIIGYAKSIEIKPGYRVLQITDMKGLVHLIDPAYSNVGMYVSNNKSVNELQGIAGTETSQLIDIDENREKRTVLAHELVTDLLDDQIGIYENQKLYDYLNNNLDSTVKLIRRYYGNDAETAILTMQEVFGVEFVCLLVDPGIISRLDQLVTFAQHEPPRKRTPIELRTEFSKSIGDKVVYRGMMLNEVEKNTIANSGVCAPALRDRSSAEKIINESFDHRNRIDFKQYGTTFKSEIFHRLTDFGDPSSSMVMSVSATKRIAESLGTHDPKGVIDDKKPYLLTLTIPKISVIEQAGVFDMERKYPFSILIGDSYFDPNDLEVEMFVPFFVAPNHLLVDRIEQPEKWSWVKQPK